MNILIIKTSSMGDVIHTLPALTDASRALKSLGKDLHFDWVVEEGFAEIPRWHPLVNKIIPVALRRWRKAPLRAINTGEWQDFYRTLRAQKYDYIIDAQGLVKSAFLTYLSKGPRVGLDRCSAREPLASLFYQRCVHVPKHQHAVTRTRQLFSQVLGYALPETIPNYGIDTARLDPHPDLTQLPEKTLLLIHGTTRADKYWPEAHWIKLANLAANQGYKIYIVWGSPAEQARSELIAASCAHATVLPKLKLAEVAALLSLVSAAVAVDTGLGHLAAALGTPTVSLYGPTDPQLIGAYGPRQLHLKTDIRGDYLPTLQPEVVWQALINHCTE